MNNENFDIQIDSFWLPRSSSTLAPYIDHGWNLALWVSYIFFFLVVALMVIFVVKYRRKSDQDTTSNVQHSTVLEVTWSVIPLVILIWCFLVGFKGFLESTVVPAGAYEVSVTASKWRWTFTYPNGKMETNELVVPAGRPVKLLMSSNDVVHSAFIPEFRVKQDVVPGQYTTLWFEAVEPGKTRLLCAEFCGTLHSEMLANVTVLPQDEFDEWVQSGAEGEDLPPEEFGEILFTRLTCNACHSTTPGLNLVGPSLHGIMGREVELDDGTTLIADENYIRESIESPAAKLVKGFGNLMPSFKGQIRDVEMNALLAYMKSLE